MLIYIYAREHEESSDLEDLGVDARYIYNIYWESFKYFLSPQYGINDQWRVFVIIVVKVKVSYNERQERFLIR
jgi:hypothetical protein